MLLSKVTYKRETERNIQYIVNSQTSKYIVILQKIIIISDNWFPF